MGYFLYLGIVLFLNVCYIGIHKQSKRKDKEVSTQLSEVEGITITQYALGGGEQGYQVTWGTDKYVSFNNWIDATVFRDLLLNAIGRS